LRHAPDPVRPSAGVLHGAQLRAGPRSPAPPGLRPPAGERTLDPRTNGVVSRILRRQHVLRRANEIDAPLAGAADPCCAGGNRGAHVPTVLPPVLLSTTAHGTAVQPERASAEHE